MASIVSWLTGRDTDDEDEGDEAAWCIVEDNECHECASDVFEKVVSKSEKKSITKLNKAQKIVGAGIFILQEIGVGYGRGKNSESLPLSDRYGSNP